MAPEMLPQPPLYSQGVDVKSSQTTEENLHHSAKPNDIVLIQQKQPRSPVAAKERKPKGYTNEDQTQALTTGDEQPRWHRQD